MTVTKIIDETIDEVKDVFNKLDIDLTSFDITGKNEAIFNSVFIKSFFNRLNKGDYEHFKELRDNFLVPTPIINDVVFTGWPTSKDSSDD